MESQTNKGALSMNSTKQLVRVVKKCISKIWEDRKVIDPEEEPGFAYRNPTWEEELPPIHPVDHLNFDDDSPPRISLFAKDGCKKFVPYPTPTQPLVEDRALVRNRWKKAFEAIMKELALRKQATLSSVGIGAQIKGKSFGIWDEYNERRLAMFRIVFSQWNEYFLLIVTWIQCLVIIFKSMHRTSPAMFSLFTLHIVDAICTSIFTVDCSLRIFCLGLIVGQTSYLRSHRWNQLDFLSTIDSWCQLGVGQFKEHDPFFRFATFRIFRQLHSLHNFAFFDYVVAIMEAIQQSLRPLYDVFLLGSVFTSMYALFGTQFFGGDLRMRCSRLSDAQIGFPEKFCNRDKGFACPRNQHCMEGSNPNFGATQFDFYPLAFLTMFQIVSLEGWSLLMYMIEQSDYKATEAYFISLVLVCSYFLVNIVVAAISGTFLRIRMEHQVLLKKKYRPDKISFYDATILASALKDTIKRSDSNKLWLGSSLRRSLTYYFKLFRAKMIYCAKCFSWDHKMKLHFRGKVLHIPPYASAGSRILASPVSATWLKIVQSKYFKHFELFSVTANLLIQCLYADTMSTLMENMIHYWEVFFLGIFALEMVLRFIAYGMTKFIYNGVNIFDTIVIIASAGSICTKAYPNISSARIIRWFYEENNDKDRHASVVANCIRGLRVLSSVAFFYMLIVLVFGIIGMELYAGEYSDFSDGYPRANFDSLFNGMLTWFTVTTGEQWVNNMWNAMRSGVKFNWVAPFIFVSYFVLTAYIIISLIIAVILENTELTDEEKKKIQKAEFIGRLKTRSSVGSATCENWVVGAVEGAQTGMERLAKRMRTMSVKPASICRNSSNGTGLQCTSQQIPDAITDSLSSSNPSENSRESSIMESGIGLTNEDVTSQQGAHKPTRRASQIIQSAGYPVNVSKQGGKGTALRNSVISLIHQESFAAENVKSEETESMHARMQKLAGRKLRGSNTSFVLAEFEELIHTYIPKAAPWYLDDTSFFLFPRDNWFRKLCIRIVHSAQYTKIYVLMVAVNIYLLAVTDAEGNFMHSPTVLHIVDCIAVAVSSNIPRLSL